MSVATLRPIIINEPIYTNKVIINIFVKTFYIIMNFKEIYQITLRSKFSFSKRVLD